MEIPKLIDVSEVDIDMTPDEGFPLRILRTYRERCNSRWKEGSGSEWGVLWETMNEHQEQRAKILDKAIAILENELRKKNVVLTKEDFELLDSPKNGNDNCDGCRCKDIEITAMYVSYDSYGYFRTMILNPPRPIFLCNVCYKKLRE